MSEIQLPKPIKNVIKHQDFRQIPKPINIFANHNRKQMSLDNLNWNYDVVGDNEFKNKYNSRINSQRMNKTIEQFSKLQQSNLNSTFCKYTKIIQDGTLAQKLSKEKQLYLTRNRRTFSQFQNNKIRDESIKKHLETRLSHFGARKINNTITFNKKQIQVQPNPQLQQLINDNIPEYWKNSLRDNEKRLKRHIKGNTFRKQVAQQMLQTLRGRKNLISTIPRIKQQYLSPICSRNSQEHRINKTFNIKGKKIKQINQEINQESTEKPKTLALKLIPRIQFQQVHKINYDSANRWQGVELC